MTPAQAARTQVTVVFLAGFALGAVATILGKRLSERRARVVAAAEPLLPKYQAPTEP